jgi:RimJ/RimL family protein N-acetyltransferase
MGRRSKCADRTEWENNMTKIPEIRTERLRLIPLSPLDAADITRLITEWDVIRMLARAPFPYTVKDAREWLAKAKDYPWAFAIYGDRFMGVIEIQGHLGYWLGKPFWGQGYMTEAAGALVDAYFEHTKSDEIISGVFHDNPGSLTVLKKLGFIRTGVSRQHSHARGGEVDHIDMVLTREARAQVKLDAGLTASD